jgi:hypothetical protein
MIAEYCLLAWQTFKITGVTADDRSPALQTLQMTGVTAESRLLP